MQQLSHAHAAAVQPRKEGGEVNEEELERLLEPSLLLDQPRGHERRVDCRSLDCPHLYTRLKLARQHGVAVEHARRAADDLEAIAAESAAEVAAAEAGATHAEDASWSW